MKTAKNGDRVRVHYVKRFQNGSVVSSRGKSPLELTVGINHPRLPGLGLALVGLAPKQKVKLMVSPEQAYGLTNPNKILRWSRERLPKDASLQKGEFIHITNRRGSRRLVRILQVHEEEVVVDTNHPWAGQTMELKVQLHSICPPESGPTDPSREEKSARENSRTSKKAGTPRRGRAIIFDVDEESLVTLRKALPEWKIEIVRGATSLSLCRDWNPAEADLLVVGVCEDNAEMLGLCRFLSFSSSFSEDFRLDPVASGILRDIRNEVGRSTTPIIVLVRPGQESLIEPTLKAGADSCLVIPIHYKEVRNMLGRMEEDNQPGRHTLNLQHPQSEDLWRDCGGEG